jgi:hypothetical protein
MSVYNCTTYQEQIQQLKNSITKKNCFILWKKKEAVADFDVALLTPLDFDKDLQLCECAYGRRFGIQVHNVLEPATFGVQSLMD